MPPPLPERFRLEVRLGRDDDLEEWLATDTSLDRPVLIRMLGPESTPERRANFITAVRKASIVSHPHLASVFLVDPTTDGAFSVSEWTGGATLAARLQSGDTIEPVEFLSNAAGLAAALASLHAEGVVHGGINLSAITYTVSHPAKLTAFGRPSFAATIEDDVTSLSRTLEEALTGAPPGGPPPSETIDGMSPAIDTVLRRGQQGHLAARALAEAFSAAPTPRQPQPESTRPSRRLLMVATGLVVAAIALVALGRVFTPSEAPILPPPAVRTPAADSSTTTLPPSTTTTVASNGSDPTVTSVEASTLDPFGGDTENDETVGAVIDNDPSTAWRTERYLDPLPLIKPGVGLTVAVQGTPGHVDLIGVTPGTSLLIGWATARSSEPADYERIVTLVAQPGNTTVQLPARTNGAWLIWLTDLPSEGSDYVASISEIRFRP